MVDTGYRVAREIELAAWVDLFSAAPSRLVLVERLGHAVALIAPQLDHPLLNRAFLEPQHPQDLAAVTARYAQLGVRRFLLHLPQAIDPSRFQGGSGLEPYRRNWVKLLGRPRVLEPGPATVAAEPALAGDAAVCARLYCEGFDLPQPAAPLFAACVERPGWQVFVARGTGAEVIGVGYLFMRAGVAYLAGGTTRRSQRGRGVQTALLRARVAAAAQAGCRWVASETGEAVAGEPQHSQRNMQRAGLDVVGVTHNFAPRGCSWSAPGRAAEPA